MRSTFLWFEQLPGADKLREHASAFDVGDDNDRGIRMRCHADVDQIVVLQVDLNRAAGASRTMASYRPASRS